MPVKETSRALYKTGEEEEEEGAAGHSGDLFGDDDQELENVDSDKIERLTSKPDS